MYFSVLWKNIQISLAELQFIKPENLEMQNWIAFFQTEFPEKLKELWWVIKWGRVIKFQDLINELQDVKIIWVPNEWVGKQIKKKYWIRRFKIVPAGHTDKEIKEKWKEILDFRNWFCGIVEWYQNISLYEDVDFAKPFRSMQMWMMPAKLAHIMINIWCSKLMSPLIKGGRGDLTIFDPFVGSWTIWFLANYLNLNFIGSDIKIDFFEKNINRRKKTKFYNSNKELEIFQHDITKPFSSSQSSEIIWTNHLESCLIITEWRLWPIVRQNTTDKEISEFQNQVWIIYEQFLQNIMHIQPAWTVFTIPYYLGKKNLLEEKIKNLSEKLWFKFSSIPEIYQRENQNIGRKIIILT